MQVQNHFRKRIGPLARGGVCNGSLFCLAFSGANKSFYRDVVIFEDKTCFVRRLVIGGYGFELMNKAGVCISTEARITDEQVFFYVPESVAVNFSDEETVKV